MPATHPQVAVTSPHLVPDEGRTRLRPFQRHRHAPLLIPADYGECWQIRSVCSCGTVWDHMAGARKKDERFGPIEADIQQHRRRRHCVVVRETRYRIYNSRFVAIQVATYLLAAVDQLSALDQIA